MRRVLLLLLLYLFCTIGIHAQVSVRYTLEPGEKYPASTLEDALEQCDLTRYLKLSERVVMKFDDGSIVNLFSVEELEAAGMAVNRSQINTSGAELRNTFSLHPNGYLVENIKKVTKKDLAKQYAE